MGVMEFLDYMDDTRETRTQGKADINQMRGYRNEWNDYVQSWNDDNADWN